MAGARSASRRASSARSTGIATPRMVGADPFRRIPRVLRAPVRHERWGLVTATVETRIDGAGRDRADRLRRRARLPDRELPRRALARVRDRRGLRPGEPLALDPARHPPRHALPDRPRPGQARALPARRDLRRRRRPASRLADLRRVGGTCPRRRASSPALGPDRLRARLPGAQRGRRRRLQADLAVRPGDRVGDRLGRSRTSGSSGRSRTRCSPTATRAPPASPRSRIGCPSRTEAQHRSPTCPGRARGARSLRSVGWLRRRKRLTRPTR